MRTRRWSLAGLLLVCGGCASAPRASIPASEIATLPAAEQEQVAAAQRRLVDAETYVTVAKQNHQAAKQFQSMATGQLGAAQTTLNADPSARRDHKVAELKAGYASQLVAMREAELDLRHAELEAARSELELAKFRALERSGRTPTVGARDFLRDRDDAQRSLARARAELARQQGEVERQRVAWDEQRRAADVAGLDRSRRQTPIPASGANEGPSQGTSTRDDNFAR